MNLTITRLSTEIFTAKSDSPYWSDGKPINERLALSPSGYLSNFEAQRFDRAMGHRYILVSGFSIRNADLVARALALEINQSFIVERKQSVKG